MNIIDKIMRMTGQSKEQIISDLASTGAISEQEARRMVMDGDTNGLIAFARGHQGQVMQNKGLMRQARYMGAPVPQNF